MWLVMNFDGSVSGVRAHQVLKGLDEVLHSHNTIDVTRIKTKEDTTKGSERTHHVRLESDGCLDMRDIRRARDRPGHVDD